MNVVHRDIKPENLLVSEYPLGTESLKLGDLGLATVVEGPLYTVCGTPTSKVQCKSGHLGCGRHGLHPPVWVHSFQKNTALDKETLQLHQSGPQRSPDPTITPTKWEECSPTHTLTPTDVGTAPPSGSSVSSPLDVSPSSTPSSPTGLLLSNMSSSCPSPSPTSERRPRSPPSSRLLPPPRPPPPRPRHPALWPSKNESPRSSWKDFRML
ncbi:uncharacterized protein [Nerophis lumbriciformis]|uniref:uncharacterized protein n=1 Tax=Nerophis lumbriciformis TaxID=546530 RepID=UPI002ADFBE99|nr:serine/threonine-protein kinase DCLK2-like [Nerophis lumbriciformis]